MQKILGRWKSVMKFGIAGAIGFSLFGAGLQSSIASETERSLYYSAVGYPTTFFANIPDMHDLDQSRSPIPVIGLRGLRIDGDAHCAPTAGVDILGFFRDHGYSEVLSTRDTSSWYDATISGMNDATLLIEGLAYEMGTVVGAGSSDGTIPSNFVRGMENRLNRDRTPSRGLFTVDSLGAFGCYQDEEIGAQKIFKKIAGGNVVSASIRYLVPDSGSSGFWRDRAGHRVVVTGTSRIAGRDYLFIVNPATTDSRTEQGLPVQHIVEIKKREFKFSAGTCAIRKWEIVSWDGEDVPMDRGERWYLSELTVIQPPFPYTGSTPLDLSTLRE